VSYIAEIKGQSKKKSMVISDPASLNIFKLF